MCMALFGIEQRLLLAYISSECLYSVIIHCHGNNISPAPLLLLLPLGRCCVADQGSEFGGGNRELRNIIIFEINKRTHITVTATRRYVPGGRQQATWVQFMGEVKVVTVDHHSKVLAAFESS